MSSPPEPPNPDATPPPTLAEVVEGFARSQETLADLASKLTALSRVQDSPLDDQAAVRGTASLLQGLTQRLGEVTSGLADVLEEATALAGPMLTALSDSDARYLTDRLLTLQSSISDRIDNRFEALESVVTNKLDSRLSGLEDVVRSSIAAIPEPASPVVVPPPVIDLTEITDRLSEVHASVTAATSQIESIVTAHGQRNDEVAHWIELSQAQQTRERKLEIMVDRLRALVPARRLKKLNGSP